MEFLLFWTAQAILKLTELFRSEGLTVYIKEPDLCIYTKIRLHAPILYFEENTNLSTLSEKHLFIGASFDTCANYNQGDYFHSFNFKVLGFGLSFVKQTGY
jgi:hypothetical protein